MSLDCGKKLENLKRSHTDTRRCKLHPLQQGIEPRTFLLRGNSANHYIITPSSWLLTYSYVIKNKLDAIWDNDKYTGSSTTNNSTELQCNSWRVESGLNSYLYFNYWSHDYVMLRHTDCSFAWLLSLRVFVSLVLFFLDLQLITVMLWFTLTACISIISSHKRQLFQEKKPPNPLFFFSYSICSVANDRQIQTVTGWWT